MVETADGVFVRTVQSATLLREGKPRGYAAEDATRNAAAYWGLPDFIFRSAQLARGTATREVGDAVVIVGAIGASVQVKSRAARTANAARERSWLNKKIAEAARQGGGTIKSLTSGAGVTLTNERGRQVLIRGQEKTWLLITVLDHPGVEDYVPAGPAVVLLRRDWEFLFEQLKSTYAVIEYLRRISTKDPVPLGDELVRYYQLAAADAGSTPSPIDHRVAKFGRGWASPLLPQAPAGHGDIRHYSLLRAVLEDVATAKLPSGVTHADMLDVLAAIDAAPVAYREEQGKLWLSWLREVAGTPPGETTWRFRSMFGDDRPYLLFAAATRHAAWVQEAFGSFVSLRHQEHLELIPERSGLMTVGILLTPRADKYGPWDTTLIAVRGEQSLGGEQRAALEGLWGKMCERAIRT